MSSAVGLQPVPDSLKDLRNRLRIIGYDFIRESKFEMRELAKRYNHAPEDYEYSIYPISDIDEDTGQIYLRGYPESSHHFSEERAHESIRSFIVEKCPRNLRTQLSGEKADWATLSAITLLAPPYGLALLGFGGFSIYREYRNATRRAKLLPKLLEKPKFC